MRVGIRVYCSVCHRQKVPHGRSASDQFSYCQQYCPGYDEEPKPGCLWPGETEKDFGYEVCPNAVEEI